MTAGPLKGKSHGYVHDSSSFEDMPPAVNNLPASVGAVTSGHAYKSLHLWYPMPVVGLDTI